MHSDFRSLKSAVDVTLVQELQLHKRLTRYKTMMAFFLCILLFKDITSMETKLEYRY